MSQPRRSGNLARSLAGAAALVLAVVANAAAPPDPNEVPRLFAQFDLPDAWEARFWADPNVKALLELDGKALADLVPTQAGVRYCRCPACDAAEGEDPLAWSLAKPKVVTCRRCGVEVPSDKYPAKDEKEKKVPEEVVQVLPQVQHHYPYHAVEPDKQRYPDERLYLAAKRDYEAREFLARAALYAAVRYHEQAAGQKDPALARLACVLVLRFAQVYPAYATHFDQPNSPKVFQQADLPPPYRRGYRTGKWDWTASLDVPMNLAIAYALLRSDPAMAEAARLLDDPQPARTIERGLFRASAEFVRLQPEEFSEMSLQAYRGMLAVGRLLNDPELVHEALRRLAGFAERGFYYDGFWRQGSTAAHQRVVGQFDGWIGRLLAGYADPPDFVAGRGESRLDLSGGAEVPMLALARAAGSALLNDPRDPEVRQAAWPPVPLQASPRHPALLGGAGLARLALGEGAGALDLEVRGQDNLGSPHFQRLAVRLAVGGRTLLGDLDELPPTASGWDRATASHNTVVVDGLNQRESLAQAIDPVLGSDFVFFAADPDFQVVAVDDRRAYPQSTTRYRQTVVGLSGARSETAIAVFEVHGGLQHDQIFHAAPGLRAGWRLAVPLRDGPDSLLPPTIPFVPSARAEDGRWFVQAYGEFAPIGQGQLVRPAIATLQPAQGAGLRLHLLGDMPVSVVTATSPDPTIAPGEREQGGDAPGRAALIVRRRSEDGSTLKSTFVTVFEAANGPGGEPAVRVGRVASPPGTVVVYFEAAGGGTQRGEHVVVNLQPGTIQTVRLADGTTLTTDGQAVRVARSGLVLAGGTFAEVQGRRVVQESASGTIVAAYRRQSGTVRGWFEAGAPLANADTLAGRVLLIRHGDGTTRGWTIERVENTESGARLFVFEEPGFILEDGATGVARYYQFPRMSAPGPHRFRIATITREVPPSR